MKNWFRLPKQEQVKLTKKPLPGSLVIENLTNLRNELYNKSCGKIDMASPEGIMLLKINSCLYTGYPKRVEDYSI